MGDALKLSPIDYHPPWRSGVEIAMVVLASLVLSLPFCNKAFHIDDPLYLAIAEQILVDPWRPFDARINWQQVTERAWNVSISPAGYSYWLAGWMALGVRDEVGLHLAGMFWTVLLGVATYAWARRLTRWPLIATLLVVASPLVIAGQNLMLDVPMLALAAAAIVLYFHATERNSIPWAVAAGVTAGLSVNVKYAGVVAVCVMALDALLWRRWRMQVAALTGVAFLVAGQWATAWAYGTPQLIYAKEWITRLWPTDWFDAMHRILLSVLYLGAGAGWPVLVAGGMFRRSWTTTTGLLVLAAAGAAATIADLERVESQTDLRLEEWNYFRSLTDLPALGPKLPRTSQVQAAIFAFSGWLALGWLVTRLVSAARCITGDRCSDARSPLRHTIILSLWTAGFWYLGTLNGPFVAPRGILPCLLSVSMVVLALGDPAVGPGPIARWGAVLLTAFVGLAVGAGDSLWAATYRDWAPRLAERYRPATGTLYFLGHWGWQHYAAAAGMVPFDPRARPLPGDLLVVPLNIDRQLLPLTVALRCRVLGRERVAAPQYLPRTRDPQGIIFLHADTHHGRIPWGWGARDDPLEVFLVLRYEG